ncbi:hypothetical protein [uncultured Planktosalinus sp.]|uniref:hypothetical protein n=1 Tax=uncultured Planktosalinus sp. TaxID=1810935 RepID=UPI0030D768F0
MKARPIFVGRAFFIELYFNLLFLLKLLLFLLMFKKLTNLLILIPLLHFSQTEAIEPHTASNWAIELKTGFTFQVDELARINEQPPLDQDIGNGIKLQFTPAMHYSLLDNLWVGGHLGFGFTNYSDKNRNIKSTSENYRIGVQLRYNFLKIISEIYLHSEVGSNYNYINLRESGLLQFKESNAYLKSYLDIGINLIFTENWTFVLIFKDVLYNYSSAPNFENRKGFGNSNVFKDFIDFPSFSVIYRLH